MTAKDLKRDTNRTEGTFTLYDQKKIDRAFAAYTKHFPKFFSPSKSEVDRAVVRLDRALRKI